MTTTDDRHARLLELATGHVCKGRLDAEALTALEEMLSLAPETCHFAGGPLWRVCEIDAETAERLRDGGTAEIATHRQTCWSMDPVALLEVQRQRFAELEEGASLLRLRRETPLGTGALDIRALFVELGLTQGTPWVLYASREREVIVSEPEIPLQVSPDMVDAIWDRDDPRAMEPQPGEEITDLEGNLVAIEKVIGLSNGGWHVQLEGGADYEVHWEFGALNGVPLPEMSPSP